MADKPTRNTKAQYTTALDRVRYVYDAGDNRKGQSTQPGAIANEIIRCAVKVKEDGEFLKVATKVTEYWYYMEDFERHGGNED